MNSRSQELIKEPYQFQGTSSVSFKVDSTAHLLLISLFYFLLNWIQLLKNEWRCLFVSSVWRRRRCHLSALLHVCFLIAVRLFKSWFTASFPFMSNLWSAVTLESLIWNQSMLVEARQSTPHTLITEPLPGSNPRYRNQTKITWIQARPSCGEWMYHPVSSSKTNNCLT